MKTKYIIGGIAVLIFAAVAVIALLPSTSMYVSLAEAKQRSGENVQVYGSPDIKTIEYNKEKNTYTFEMFDKEGTRMKVLAQGAPPTAKMKDAKQVVAKGTYKDGIFHTKELLLKCPSKYEKKAE